MSAFRSSKPTSATSVLGSADLWLAMQTNMCPRTLRAGAPYIVDSSASGNASPSFRTLVKCISLIDWKRHKKMMPAQSKLFNVAKAGAPTLFPVGQSRLAELATIFEEGLASTMAIFLCSVGTSA